MNENQQNRQTILDIANVLALRKVGKEDEKLIEVLEQIKQHLAGKMPAGLTGGSKSKSGGGILGEFLGGVASPVSGALDRLKEVFSSSEEVLETQKEAKETVTDQRELLEELVQVNSQMLELMRKVWGKQPAKVATKVTEKPTFRYQERRVMGEGGESGIPDAPMTQQQTQPEAAPGAGLLGGILDLLPGGRGKVAAGAGVGAVLSRWGGKVLSSGKALGGSIKGMGTKVGTIAAPWLARASGLVGKVASVGGGKLLGGAAGAALGGYAAYKGWNAADEMLASGVISPEEATERKSGAVGSGIGATIGGIGGGILGSLAGPAGTLAGGAAGGLIGEAAGKYVGEKVGSGINYVKQLNVVDRLKEFGSSVSDRLEATRLGVVGGISNAYQYAGNTYNAVTGGVKNFASNAISGLQSNVSNFTDNAKAFGSMIGSKTSNIWNRAGSIASGLSATGNKISSSIGNAFQSAPDRAAALMSEAQKVLAPLATMTPSAALVAAGVGAGGGSVSSNMLKMQTDLEKTKTIINSSSESASSATKVAAVTTTNVMNNNTSSFVPVKAAPRMDSSFTRFQDRTATFNR